MSTPVRFKAYRVALDPTRAQAEALARHSGAARAGYNFHLAARVAAHRQWRQLVAEATYSQMDGQYVIADSNAAYVAARKNIRLSAPSYGESMKALKLDKRYAWYSEVNLYALSSGMRAADTAWRNWLDSLAGRRAGRKVGYPRFAKKGRRESFTLYHDKHRPTLRPDGYRRLNLPTKAGGSIRLHGNIRALARRIGRGDAVISSVTITKGGHRWWVSILAEETVPAAAPTRAQTEAGTVGLDWGVTTLATLSDGSSITNPRHLRKAATKLRKAQRALSRTGWYRASDGALIHHVKNRVPRTPTAGRRRAQQQLAKAHAQLAEARRGYLHQVTKTLASSWAVIAIEDLNVSGMTRRPAPIHDEQSGAFQPNGARAKAGLTRSILDAAPGELRRQLTYKTSWYGSHLVVVDQWLPSSKTCSACGAVKPKLRLSERTYVCPACGLTIGRDLNAAINIATAAQKQQQVASDTGETPAIPNGRPATSSEDVGKRRSSRAQPPHRGHRTTLKPEGRPTGRSPDRSNPVAFHHIA